MMDVEPIERPILVALNNTLDNALKLRAQTIMLSHYLDALIETGGTGGDFFGAEGIIEAIEHHTHDISSLAYIITERDCDAVLAAANAMIAAQTARAQALLRQARVQP